MRILLMGGTGAMGIHLANLLSNKDNKVVVTSRSKRVNSEFVEYRHGNAKNLEFLSNILSERWDVIVDFMIYSFDEFKERFELLLDSTNQYVFLSSARVYNDSNDNINEETFRLLDTSNDTDYLNTNEYALLKARQENMLSMSNSKNWTIVRPYITYGENRLQLGNLEKENWLYRALKGRTIIFSKDINDKLTTLTYGLDVASGIVALINNPKSYGQMYNITSNSTHKWSEILEIYLDVIEKKTGKRPNIIYQDLKDYMSWNPAKYQIIYDRLFNRKFDNTKISEFIDINTLVRTNQGLKKCMEEFLGRQEFGYINWRSEAEKDKYTNEITPLKEIKGVKQKVKYFIFRFII